MLSGANSCKSVISRRPRQQTEGSKRHELPAKQIGKRIIRQHHKIHADQKGREEGQYAMRRWVVMAVAETVKACCCSTQIDHDKEKRSQRVQAEMGAKPRQSDRQSQV